MLCSVFRMFPAGFTLLQTNLLQREGGSGPVGKVGRFCERSRGSHTLPLRCEKCVMGLLRSGHACDAPPALTPSQVLLHPPFPQQQEQILQVQESTLTGFSTTAGGPGK